MYDAHARFQSTNNCRGRGFAGPAPNTPWPLLMYVLNAAVSFAATKTSA